MEYVTGKGCIQRKDISILAISDIRLSVELTVRGIREVMSSKHTHLEMIQGIVNRLSHNSFLLKGWSVVLVSAMFALAAKDSQLLFVYLAYFPAISFWCLDGYFLHQERLFRKLYDRVRSLSEDEIDFSMNTESVRNQVDPWVKVTLSKTLLAFHGVILVSIILVTAISIYLKQGGS